MSRKRITACLCPNTMTGAVALNVRMATRWMLCALLMLVSGCDDGIASAAPLSFRIHNRTSNTLTFAREVFVEGHMLDWSTYGAWNDEPTTQPCEGSRFAVPTTTMDPELAPNEHGVLRWDPIVVERVGDTQGPPVNEGWCENLVPVADGSYDIAICPNASVILRDGVYCSVFYECPTVRVRVSHVAREYAITFTDDDASTCEE